jgi:C4-dicarboxylate-specific signal transduction histidine kinase
MRYDELTTSQLSFIGKILAVFSHEINNHLAILKESVGLIGDLIELGKTSSRKDLKEILKITQSIKDQIEQTTYFCNKLNGFGHGMEKPLSDFNIHRSIEELMVLLGRVMNQKMVRLEKDFTANMPLFHSNPLKIQFLIFCLIEKYLRGLDKNGSIIIKTAHSNDSIGITVIPKGNWIERNEDEEVICKDEIYENIIEQLGGRVSQRTGDETTIMFPVSISSGSNRS